MIKKILAANAVSIACVLSAFLLALKGVDGWGWFLAIAVLFGHTLSKGE